VSRFDITAVLMGLAGSRMAAAETVIGWGVNSSCGEWLTARNNSTRNPFPSFYMSSWAMGYVSGAATIGAVGDPLKDVDPNAFQYWVDNHCRTYPGEPLIGALEAFIREHGPKPPGEGR
jgi:hypothetical protein